MFLQRVINTQNNVVTTDRMWARLLSSTNQPGFTKPSEKEGGEEAIETSNYLKSPNPHLPFEQTMESANEIDNTN